MIRFNHDGNNFVLKFNHPTLPATDIAEQFGIIVSDNLEGERRCSVVSLECLDSDGEPTDVFEGIAVVNPKDNFSKITGRRLALTDLMEMLKDHDLGSKEFCTKLWDEYKSKCKFRNKK
jgi:hypothetical protein